MIGWSPCRQWAYVYARCEKCRGSGSVQVGPWGRAVATGPTADELEAWADEVGFRWPGVRAGQRGACGCLAHHGHVILEANELAGEICADRAGARGRLEEP